MWRTTGRSPGSARSSTIPTADYEYFGSFTPDGTSVLFASQTGCVFQAWLAPVDDPTAAVAIGEPLDHPSGCAVANGLWSESCRG